MCMPPIYRPMQFANLNVAPTLAPSEFAISGAASLGQSSMPNGVKAVLLETDNGIVAENGPSGAIEEGETREGGEQQQPPQQPPPQQQQQQRQQQRQQQQQRQRQQPPQQEPLRATANEEPSPVRATPVGNRCPDAAAPSPKPDPGPNVRT